MPHYTVDVRLDLDEIFSEVTDKQLLDEVEQRDLYTKPIMQRDHKDALHRAASQLRKLGDLKSAREIEETILELEDRK